QPGCMCSSTPTSNCFPASIAVVLATSRTSTGDGSSALADTAANRTARAASSRIGASVVLNSAARLKPGSGSAVAMHGVGRERGQADGHVLGAVRFRRRVAHPLARAYDHGLARPHVERARAMRHA